MKLALEWCYQKTEKVSPVQRKVKTFTGAKTALSLLLVPITLLFAAYTGLKSSQLPALALVGALDSPMDLRLSAMDYMLKGDNDHALALYSTAIEAAAAQYGTSSSFLADLYYEAGSLASRVDQFDKADSYLNKAVKANPRLSMARMELADLHRRRQKPMEALEQIQTDLAAHPQSVVAKQQFVRWLALNGQNPQDGAIAHIESLKLLALTGVSKNMPVKDELSRMLQNTSTSQIKPSVVTTPAADNTSETSGETETAPATIKPLMSLPGRPKVKSADELKLEQDKQIVLQKAKDNELQMKARQAKAQALSQAEQRQKDQERARERREQTRKQAEAASRARAQKSNKVKPAQSPPAEPAAEKPQSAHAPVKENNTPESASAEATARAEIKNKKTARSRPAQEVVPQMVPMLPAMQPSFYPSPVVNLPSRGKPKPGFVAPPPPMSVAPYPGGMPMGAPMMVQPMAPPAVKKARPKAVKKVEEAKPEPEDKPPPMVAPGEDDSGTFLLDWGDAKAKDKRKKRLP